MSEEKEKTYEVIIFHEYAARAVLRAAAFTSTHTAIRSCLVGLRL